MTGAELLLLISGAFQFPAAMLKLIRFLKSMSPEQLDAAQKHFSASLDTFDQTGRPGSWD